MFPWPMRVWVIVDTSFHRRSKIRVGIGEQLLPFVLVFDRELFPRLPYLQNLIAHIRDCAAHIPRTTRTIITYDPLEDREDGYLPLPKPHSALRRRQPSVHIILTAQGYSPWHHPYYGSHWLRLQPRGAWAYKEHDVPGFGKSQNYTRWPKTPAWRIYSRKKDRDALAASEQGSTAAEIKDNKAS